MSDTPTPIDIHALTAILAALRAIDLQIDALKAQGTPLRAEARDLLRGHPTITVPGIATARDVPDSVQASYDRAALDTLVVRLAATHPEIAAAISATRKEKKHSGHLWIAFAKE